MGLGATLKRGQRSMAAARGVPMPTPGKSVVDSGAGGAGTPGGSNGGVKFKEGPRRRETGRKRTGGGGGGGDSNGPSRPSSVGGNSLASRTIQNQRLNPDPGDASRLPRALKQGTASAR